MKLHPTQIPHRERGVVLLIALIALVAMTLAAIGLVRSVDTGNLILGNLAFKQGATTAADPVIETARAWLQASDPSTLSVNGAAGSGYYATSQDTLDLLGNKTPSDNTDDVNWDGNTAGPGVSTAKTVTDIAGNKAAYIIHRLCKAELGVNDPNNSCRTATVASSGTSKGSGYGIYAASSGGTGSGSVLNAYYRVVVRIQGPRNTVSYVEAILL